MTEIIFEGEKVIFFGKEKVVVYKEENGTLRKVHSRLYGNGIDSAINRRETVLANEDELIGLKQRFATRDYGVFYPTL